jgi:antitoxin PrlF
MATGTVSSKGQIVIPAEVRAELGVEAGSRVEFVKTEQGWLLRSATQHVTALKGMVKARRKPVALEEMRRAIGRAVRRSAA